MLYGNLPTPQNLPINGACSSRPSYTESQSYGQCSEPEPISRIGHIIIFSHLTAKQKRKKLHEEMKESWSRQMRLTAARRQKNAHFVDTVWWTVVVCANDSDNAMTVGTVPGMLVIARNTFGGDSHGIHAHNTTWSRDKRIFQSELKPIGEFLTN